MCDATAAWNFFLFVLFIILLVFIIYNWNELGGAWCILWILFLIVFFVLLAAPDVPSGNKVIIVNGSGDAGSYTKSVTRTFDLGPGAKAAYVIDAPNYVTVDKKAPAKPVTVQVSVDGVECAAIDQAICPGNIAFTRSIRFVDPKVSQGGDDNNPYGMVLVATSTSPNGSVVNVYQSAKLHQFVVEVLAGGNVVSGTVNVRTSTEQDITGFKVRAV
ncbi:Hypothetical protein POVN_LOCUS27 [uncultured virus]|nr:Hypothetical protein POVN_LOCUS27 [uncultured virus]